VGFASALSQGPGESGQTLSFNITGNTNAALFSSAPSLAPNGTLSFTSAPNAFGSAQITVTLSDNGSNTAPNRNTSDPQNFTITIRAQNDAPTLGNIESGVLTFVENGAATPVSATITVDDADMSALSGATITISAGFAQGEDVLDFTPQNGISGSFNASSGVLLLSGNASLAQYQAALRSVTFRNTSENPSTSTRTVSFVVRDASGSSNNSSNTQSRSVTVAP
jgi:hypothetical protein